jgi:hypothetical protein
MAKTGMPARYPVVVAIRVSAETDRALRRRALLDDRRLGAFLRRALERLADSGEPHEKGRVEGAA